MWWWCDSWVVLFEDEKGSQGGHTRWRGRWRRGWLRPDELGSWSEASLLCVCVCEDVDGLVGR